MLMRNGDLSLMSMGLLGLQSFDSCRLPALGDTCNKQEKFVKLFFLKIKIYFQQIGWHAGCWTDIILHIVDVTILQWMSFKDGN